MKPLPLFPDDPVDAVVRQTRRTKDEIDYEKAKRRESRGKRQPMPTAPETGPCCLRCRNWRAPVDEGYGECRHLAVVEERNLAYGIERGDVVAMEDARAVYRIAASRLRTNEAFSCSAYGAREGIAA
jgi:hypothetical protein